jgi:hypothetical protein
MEATLSRSSEIVQNKYALENGEYLIIEEAFSFNEMPGEGRPYIEKRFTNGNVKIVDSQGNVLFTRAMQTPEPIQTDHENISYRKNPYL